MLRVFHIALESVFILIMLYNNFKTQEWQRNQIIIILFHQIAMNTN